MWYTSVCFGLGEHEADCERTATETNIFSIVYLRAHHGYHIVFSKTKENVKLSRCERMEVSMGLL